MTPQGVTFSLSTLPTLYLKIFFLELLFGSSNNSLWSVLKIPHTGDKASDADSSTAAKKLLGTFFYYLPAAIAAAAAKGLLRKAFTLSLVVKDSMKASAQRADALKSWAS